MSFITSNSSKDFVEMIESTVFGDEKRTIRLETVIKLKRKKLLDYENY